MPRDDDMAKHLITMVTVPFLALILSACAVPRNADSVPATDNGQDTTASLPKAPGSDVDTASQTDDVVDDESSPTVALPPLSFTWNTDYASFLTAPRPRKTVRRAATRLLSWPASHWMLTVPRLISPAVVLLTKVGICWLGGQSCGILSIRFLCL